MRILVTGGSGRLGRWVMRDLVEQGYEVVNADQRPHPTEGNMANLRAVPFREVALTDVGQVLGAMHGCAAVIHLGAIPAPGRHPDAALFANNTGATFAVLHAAALLGVGKAVIASSVSAYGMAWAPKPFQPLYAPLDEAHPLLVQDPYGLSKEVDERTAEMFHHRTGMQVLAYRFHWIGLADEARELAAQVRVQPATHATNLWGWVDTRDAAQACRLGIEKEGLGFAAFNIIAADSLCDEPTEAMIRQFCPATEIRQPIQGTTSAWSIEKAHRLLGYQPQYTWRDKAL